MDGWLNVVLLGIASHSSWSTSLSIQPWGWHVKYPWRCLPVLLRVKPFMVAWIHQELPRSRMFGLESVVPPMKWTCLWYVHFGTTRVTPCSDIDCCLVPIFVAWHSRLHFVWFKLYSVGQVSPSWSRIRLIEHDESMLNRPRAVVETCLNPEIRAWFMHVYDQF